jgi:uncharacterized Zn-binding protein involved in type VI secretion
MGKPAARQGDMTAHGGAITIGCPTVLIGGLPAARLGDMHTCPMATPGTPPIPHVGGPVSMSSAPTVLIGGTPAACVGDMLVCVGPPDTIIPPGCPTVLIGTGGGGGGGGAGAGGGGGSGTTADSGEGDSGDAETEEDTSERHFLDVKIMDNGDFPIDGMSFTLKSPDGTTETGILTGEVRRDGVEQGDHEIELRGIIDARWSKNAAKVGDNVTMKIKTAGIESGTSATLEIFIKDANFSNRQLKIIETSINDNAIDQDWTLEVDEDLLRVSKEKELQGGYSYPYFFFVVTVADMKLRSGLLSYADKIEINLKDQDGQALGNRTYRLRLATGEVREGTTDSNGHAEEDNIPPGGARLSYRVRQ